MARHDTTAEDRRIRRTRSLLHQALTSLVREKDYDAISVRDILERANVGRSTFYLHFANKDELLVDGIRNMLDAIPVREVPASMPCPERIVRFSRPFLEHVRTNMEAAHAPTGTRGRAVLHAHLTGILAGWIEKEVRRALPRRPKAGIPVPPGLLAAHVASTFVLVLDGWVEQRSPPSAAEADGLFRALVMPVLTRVCGEAHR